MKYTFKKWLSLRRKEDSAAGFLSRTLANGEKWCGHTPESLRDWVRRHSYHDNLLLCVDIAEVEYEIWCDNLRKEKENNDKLLRQKLDKLGEIHDKPQYYF